MLRSTLLSGAAILAMTVAANAQDKVPDEQGKPPPAASQKAPGQMKDAGAPAREVAPGRIGGGDNAENKDDGRDKDRAADKADREDQGRSDKSMKNGDAKADADRDKARARAEDDRGDKDRGATGASKSERTEKGDGKSGKGSLSSVSPEQKTKVRDAFSRNRAAPVKDLDISINVGVVVPRTVHFHRVPREVVVLAPGYEDYLYFVVGDRICIVDPDTYEIVDIIVIA